MKNYAKEVERAGIGRTPQLCQDALKEMLEELFEGRKFMGQEGRKPLTIIRQDIDIPEDNDEDVDTDMSAAPYIKVAMTGGEIPDDNSPQLVEFSLTICAYDTGTQRTSKRTSYSAYARAPISGARLPSSNPLRGPSSRTRRRPITLPRAFLPARHRPSRKTVN